MQKGRIRKSESLKDSERLYSIYDKEILAIMHALAKFKQYLVGSKFIVKIEHTSLQHFLEQKDMNKRQQKWVSKVQAYDFDIEYVKGYKNVGDNALSRKPTTCSLMEIIEDGKAHLLAEYSKNKFVYVLTNGHIQDDRHKIINDNVFYKNRMYLVPESMLKEKAFKATYDITLARHQRFFKDYR